MNVERSAEGHRRSGGSQTTGNTLPVSRRLSVGLALLLAAWSGLVVHGAAITNVTVANVTPSGFTIVWATPPTLQPSLRLYADPAGTVSLDGTVGMELSPVHTGSAVVPDEYGRRLHRQSLRQKLRESGWAQARLTGCAPDTAYYYRLVSTAAGGAQSFYPETGPLPSVRTARENRFVLDSQQLLLYVPGPDVEGRVVLLTHSNATSALSAVLGDGAGTNEVFFNLNDLFGLVATSNFTPLGPQPFAVRMAGEAGQLGEAQEFVLTFAPNFSVAGASFNSVSREFFILEIGSSIVPAGQAGSVRLAYDTSVGMNRVSVGLEIPPGHLTGLALTGLAPEIDPASVVVAPTQVSFGTFPGQTLFGAGQLGRLSFTVLSNQSSAFVPLRITSLEGFKPGLTAVSDLRGQSGRVVVVGAEPLLEAGMLPGGGRDLILYGKPMATYAIQSAPSVGSVDWATVLRLPMTNGLAQHFPALAGNNGTVFYRASEFIADPPMLQPIPGSGPAPALLVFGIPGASYTLQSATNLSGPLAWRPVLTYTLTNAFRTLGGLEAPADNVFFRVKKP